MRATISYRSEFVCVSSTFLPDSKEAGLVWQMGYRACDDITAGELILNR